MLRLVVLYLGFVVILSAQEPPSSGSDSASGANDTTQEDNLHQQDKALDKAYYQYYFKTLPKKRAEEKRKLEYNLIRSLKSQISVKDAGHATEVLSKINPETIRYERIDEDSVWFRGIKNEMKYLRTQDYMYIIIYDKYYCFLSYEMDPAKFIQEPFQIELIFTGREDQFQFEPPAP